MQNKLKRKTLLWWSFLFYKWGVPVSPRLCSSCTELGRMLLIILTEFLGYSVIWRTIPAMTSLDLSFFFVPKSSTGSNNCSQLHIQTGTDLQWFQEGPCLLLCFTLCMWPLATNLFYLFLPFSHDITILYWKHLSFCNPLPQPSEIQLAEVSVVPSMGCAGVNESRIHPQCFQRRVSGCQTLHKADNGITAEYLGIFPWESAA